MNRTQTLQMYLNQVAILQDEEKNVKNGTVDVE